MISFLQFLDEAKRAKDSDHIDLFHGTYSDHQNFSSIDPNKGKPLGQGSGFYAFGGRKSARNYSKQAQDVVTGKSSIEVGGKSGTQTSKKMMVSTRTHIDHVIPDAELMAHSPKQVDIAKEWLTNNSDRIVLSIKKHASENNLNPESARFKKVGTTPILYSPSTPTMTRSYKFEQDAETSGQARNSQIFDILHKHDRPLLSNLVKQLHSGDRENFAGRYVGSKISDKSNIKLSQV